MEAFKKKKKIQLEYNLNITLSPLRWSKRGWRKWRKENTCWGNAASEPAMAGREIKAKRSFWQWTEPPLKPTAGEEPSVSFLTGTAERKTCYVLHSEASPRWLLWNTAIGGKEKVGSGRKEGNSIILLSIATYQMWLVLPITYRYASKRVKLLRHGEIRSFWIWIVQGIVRCFSNNIQTWLLCFERKKCEQFIPLNVKVV